MLDCRSQVMIHQKKAVKRKQYITCYQENQEIYKTAKKAAAQAKVRATDEALRERKEIEN